MPPVPAEIADSGALGREPFLNPLSRVWLYKHEIFNLYCPRLDARSGLGAITAGLVFTQVETSQFEEELEELRRGSTGMTKYPKLHPLTGAEELHSRDLDAIFPMWKREQSAQMSQEIADDLRAWLREPFHSREERIPLKLDQRQRELVASRTESGFRRLRGPAGAGKSLVVAARAAELASQGKQVLVASFNITLLNYLRGLAKRHRTVQQQSGGEIVFLHFHAWCKRVCTLTDQLHRYQELWHGQDEEGYDERNPVLEEDLAQLVRNLYDDPSLASLLPRYDAILVDEGQDYRTSWWQTLRKAARDGAEMVLAADKTQDVYATADAWTEESMANAGFRGPWSELRVSYRLPPALIEAAGRFAREFLSEGKVDLPSPDRGSGQLELAGQYPVDLKWVQIASHTLAEQACFAEIREQMSRLKSDTAIPDITFLADKKVGRKVVAVLEGRNVHVLHTFDSDSAVARRQKLAFVHGSARVKATTLQSFKGWEARHLVVYVDRFSSPTSRAVLYTALTRLLRHERGSALSVVTPCRELKSFGKTWPGYVECNAIEEPT